MKEIPLHTLLYNNSRKMHHIPMHRKAGKGKRVKYRCEPMETVGAYIDWTNGIYDK